MSIEGALSTKTVKVAHLEGTSIGYHLPKAISHSKPTLVLIPGFASNATTFRHQVADPSLLEIANVLVLEALGYGSTKTSSPTWTAWDSATCLLQAMEALGVRKAFVLGAGEGGWIGLRMALYAPDKVSGNILVGSTTMGAAGPVALGSHDISQELIGLVKMTETPNPKFELPAGGAKTLVETSLGPEASEADVKIWTDIPLQSYKGDAGRLRFRQTLINMLSRDPLQLRVGEIQTPVLYIIGSEDKIYTEKVAKEDIKAFKSDVQFAKIDGAYHSPVWTHAKETNSIVAEFLKKNGGKVNAQALREAVGMVDI